ncbi:hypothetical protein DRO35_00880 [Candidatus Bathyarchaeota archaeon]|nr:MAG: hypothetical protein DRO35_00880 [Candidatus Bathyarchaeota archaeon]
MLLTEKRRNSFFREKSKPELKPPSSTYSRRQYVCCKQCSCTIDLSKAKISGYNSEHSLQHIHCNECGKIIKWLPREKDKIGIVEGVFGILLGGVLAYLLFPSLKVYGLQAGFFTSLYGLFKVLIA